MLPREAPEPAQGALQDDLQGLRLTPPRRRLVPGLLTAGLAGLAFSLAFPPLALGWAALPSLVPLLAAVRRAGPARGALVGAAFGLGAFGAILSWIRLFGEAPYVLLIGLSAAFIALFGALAPLVWRDHAPVRSSFALAGLWVVIEWLRGTWPLGGLTWGQVASSQVDVWPVARWAPIGGAWSMSFLVLLLAALAIVVWERWGSARRLSALTIAGVSIVGTGASLLLPTYPATGDAISVATVQLDVRPFRPMSGADEDIAIAGEHARLHRALGTQAPDLVVWGEGALDPGATRDVTAMLTVRRAIAAVGAPTLAGAVTVDEEGEERTEALLFDGSGALVDRYAKVHLVPFGEYVPWRSRLEWFDALRQIPVDRVPGPRPRTITVAGLPPFGTPICFENAFADIERAMVLDGARFLVLTINNASYEETSASAQHLEMSRLRAIETGRWVVHAAISGVTAVIAPDGEVVAHRGLFETGVTRALIRASTAQTPFVRFGDWVVVLSAVGVVAAALRPPPRPRAERPLTGPLSASVRTLVIIPTYDEAGTIRTAIDRALAADPAIDVLVVDDGSPDGTADIVAAHPAFGARVRLEQRRSKSGLASAYLLGFERARTGGYDLAVEMDADLSHDPDDLARLLPAARGADLVIGSRYVAGGGVSDWGLGRRLLSRWGNAYVRLALGLDVRDATAGYRVYRTEALERLLDRPISADGYAFQIEMTLRASDTGLRIEEIPIVFAERAEGRSKMSRRIVVEALLLVTGWGIRARLRDPSTSHPQRP